MKYNKGVSFLELVLAIAIISIISAAAVPSFSGFRNRQSIKNTTEDIVSLLNEARTDTLSSISSTYYSVHLETTRAVLFTGGTFDTNAASNKVITYDAVVTVPLASVLLNGGGYDVKFDRLTGDTSQYGTIQVNLISDSNSKKVITINKIGVVSAN